MPRFNFTFHEASPLISHTLLRTAESSEHDALLASHDGRSRKQKSSNTMTSLSFNGTGISIYGALHPKHGNHSIILDGSYQRTASGNGSAASKSALWEIYNLAYGSHVVKITNQLSDSNLWSHLDIDRVQIERAIGHENDTINHSTLNFSSPFIDYTHHWKPSMPSHSRKEKHTIQTVSPNSRFAIKFQGCCIELYGRTIAGYKVSLDGRSPVQMQGKNVSSTKADMQHSKTLLYMVDGLIEDVNHTVTVSTLSSTSNKRPFSFDHAVVMSTQSFISGTPFLRTASFPSSSAHHRLELIIGVTVGGIVLLALVGVAVLVLYRRWKRRIPWRVDLSEEVDLPKPVSAPVPWLLLRPARRPSSSWQLSSVMSGWRRISGDQTESGIAPSTLSPSQSGFCSSTTISNPSSPRAPRQPQPQNLRLNIANR